MDILLENLSQAQHEIWSHWMKYLFSVCKINEDGSLTIPVDKVLRWKGQMNTPYQALSELEKESDREQAKKIIALVKFMFDG